MVVLLGTTSACDDPSVLTDVQPPVGATLHSTGVPWHDTAIVYRDEGTPTTRFEVPTRTSLGLSTSPADPPPDIHVDPVVQAAIDAYHATGQDDLLTVVVWFPDPNDALVDDHPTAVVWEGWYDGTLTNTTDWETAFNTAMTTREGKVTTLVTSGLSTLATPYVELSRGERLPFAVLEAPASSVSAWVAAGHVEAVDTDAAPKPEANGGDIELTGTEEFYGSSYSLGTPGALDYGGDLGGANIGVVIEGQDPTAVPNNPDPGHPVLLDAASSTPRLHANWYTADSSGRTLANTWSLLLCSSPTFLECNAHATTMVQIFGGDITLGQDPAVTSPTERVIRSGVARTSEPEFALHTTRSGMIHLLDLFLGDPRRRLTSNSYGWENADCKPTGTDERAVNEAFLAGTAYVKSAGNQGGAVLNRCEVSSPASAAGAFVVGGVLDTFLWAGTSARGHRNNRTIVDVASFMRWEKAAIEGGGYFPPPGSTDQRSGTSNAAAIVSGSVMLIAEHLTDRVGGTLNPHLSHAGSLHSHLLILADGTDGLGSTMTSGTSRMTGAGMFRPVPITGSDLGPIYLNGSVCVGHGEEVSVPIRYTGAGLPSGVSTVEVVAHWVDPRTEDGRVENRIDLSLFNATTGVTLKSDGGSDEEDKRRVLELGATPGHDLRLVLQGVDIRGDDDPLCPGAERQRVFFAALAD